MESDMGAGIVDMATARETGGSAGLRIGLWVVQALLAFAFLGAGSQHLTASYADMARQFRAVQYTPELLVRFIGVAEVSGALGLILPAVTRIKPILTPLAASGLVVIMVLATALHIAIGEVPVVTTILGGLAAFVAWGRFRKAPIAPRA